MNIFPGGMDMLEQVQQEIWRKATDLLVPVYAATAKFPQDELQTQMNQLRAAAVGIVLNLTEGLSCENDLDLQHFLDSSLRDARDCITGLQIALRLEWCPPKEAEELIARAEEIVRLLTGMMGSLKTAET